MYSATTTSSKEVTKANTAPEKHSRQHEGQGHLAEAGQRTCPQARCGELEPIVEGLKGRADRHDDERQGQDGVCKEEAGERSDQLPAQEGAEGGNSDDDHGDDHRGEQQTVDERLARETATHQRHRGRCAQDRGEQHDRYAEPQ